MNYEFWFFIFGIDHINNFSPPEMDYDSLRLPEDSEPLQSFENLRHQVTSLILELADVIERTDKLDQLATSHQVPKISKAFKTEGSGDLDLNLCDDEDVFCGFGPDPTKSLEFEGSGDLENIITLTTASPPVYKKPVSGATKVFLSWVILSFSFLIVTLL